MQDEAWPTQMRTNYLPPPWAHQRVPRLCIQSRQAEDKLSYLDFYFNTYLLKHFVLFVYHFMEKNSICLGFEVVFLTLHIKWLNIKRI